MGLRSGIRDPGSGKNLFRIPDQGVKNAPDPQHCVQHKSFLIFTATNSPRPSQAPTWATSFLSPAAPVLAWRPPSLLSPDPLPEDLRQDLSSL
jgi:hypothetical protein